jgi:cyclooctat-9-en-7-ol 5-monooxygenase
VPLGVISARSYFRDPVGYVRSRGGDGLRPALMGGRNRFVVVRDPLDVWRVLVTEADAFAPGKWKRRVRRTLGPTLNTLHGEEHRRRRTVLQPAFDRRRIAGFAASMAARVERALSAWRDGDRIVVRDTLEPLSLTIAGDVLVSADLEAVAPELATALMDVMTNLPRLVSTARRPRAGRSLAYAQETIRTLVAARRASRGDGADLLDRLLADGLADEAVANELLAVLLAAVDEPPSALEAAFYLLGRDPSAEARLHAELAASGSSVTLERLEGLPYLEAVVRETLRLLPPARHIDRCPVRDLHLAGAIVPRGANVVVSPLVVQREGGPYEHAGEFDPDRWLDTGHRPPRGAYIPFGAGPHACIGEPLARSIILLTLAAVCARWRLLVERDAPEPTPRAPRLAVTLSRR